MIEEKSSLEEYRILNPLQIDLFSFVPDVIVPIETQQNVLTGYVNSIKNKIKNKKQNLSNVDKSK